MGHMQDFVNKVVSQEDLLHASTVQCHSYGSLFGTHVNFCIVPGVAQEAQHSTGSTAQHDKGACTPAGAGAAVFSSIRGAETRGQELRTLGQFAVSRTM